MNDFDRLPRSARVWVFASDRPLNGADSKRLLAAVDDFLAGWKAHGTPLRSARQWRDDHFLAIGVDPSAEQASGCSIDGLFRSLQRLERELGTALVAGGRVFYRDGDGPVKSVTRNQARALLAGGRITPDTPVYDTSVTDAGSWRDRFELPAKNSWLAKLADQASQDSSRSATNSSSLRNG